MADKKFFNQLRQYDQMALNLSINAAVNNQFSINANTPSSAVLELESIFEVIRESGKEYNKSPKFLDPGCGYGIPLVLAAKAGYETYGIDKERTMVNITKVLTNNLKEKSIINGNIQNIVCGDMFEPLTYDTLGINFNDIDIFYLYALRSIHEDFLPKFSKSAKSGSHLINLPGFKERKREFLFENIKNIKLILQGPDNGYQIYRKY